MEENNEEKQADPVEENSPLPEQDPPSVREEPAGDRPARKIPWGWLCALIFAVAFSVMLTYTLTAAKVRDRELRSLQSDAAELSEGNAPRDLRNMQNLLQALKNRSYYANSMEELTGDALLKAVLDAYVNETGDVYAAYYTEEEYAALSMDMAGNHVGIGVTITRETLDLPGGEAEAYRIEEVYPGSGAEEAGLQAGEWIGAVKKDGAYISVGQLGLEAAAAEIRGEAGTAIELVILHRNGNNYESRIVAVKRSAVITRSVRLTYAEGDPTVAVVRISEFDYTTPTQFAEAMETAKENGALHFVFDVRGNPGGELDSIYAVLSNFLLQDELVLKMVDANGSSVAEYPMKPVQYSGVRAGCSVTQEQIGRYRDLDFVVLCDGNTASAAEVFTAALRDFGLAKEIVGIKTFGKGIVQGYYRLELEDLVGYLKLTIAGYVTQCGTSYHGIGIEPTVQTAPLPESVRGRTTTFLPWEDDTQLQTAVACFS